MGRFTGSQSPIAGSQSPIAGSQSPIAGSQSLAGNRYHVGSAYSTMLKLKAEPSQMHYKSETCNEEREFTNALQVRDL
ncbi:MAG: hypothetical protein WBF90_23890 [Rivularia sp. (in: cyanobacteria)]